MRGRKPAIPALRLWYSIAHSLQVGRGAGCILRFPFVEDQLMTTLRELIKDRRLYSVDANRTVLEAALKCDGKVKGFPPDVLMFFAYLIAHDAHHRGQITMLARQLGYAVPQKVMFGMWEWNTRAKE